MSETENTKVCPLCAEPIRPAAKVCPHCRHWLKKWSLYNPQVGAAIILGLYLVVVVVTVAVFEKLFGSKRDLSAYQGQIDILSSELSFRINGTNRYVTVVGIVTNKCDFPWNEVGIEAQCFDTNGKLIDVIPAKGDFRGIPVLARSESAFKIESSAAQPEANYSSHKAFVRWAKDPSAWP